MDIKTEANNFLENGKEYIDAKLDLLVLNTAEKSAMIIAKLTSGILILAFMFMIIFLVSIGGALLLGQWFGNIAVGFFILAAILALLMYLAISQSKKWIQKAVLEIVADSIKK
ncbi:MAG: hypothetical protein R2774_11310 [Saprospiraceae bacterium]